MNDIESKTPPITLTGLAETMTRVGNIGGGEYAGPCPKCRGDDRFHVWPDEWDTGRFWCRKCGWMGSGIDFLVQQHKITFAEACRVLGTEAKPRRRRIKIDHSSWKLKPIKTESVPPWLARPQDEV